MNTHTQLLIIGSGPAGLTAAIYAARANLAPVCIAGISAGGQLMTTSDVENYPGFPAGITGPELMKLWREQAERFGTQFVNDDASRVDFSSRPFKITTGKTTYETDAVIIATGASAVWLGLANEKRLQGRGVTACATCDGFFYKEKEVAVIGGGDTAMEEANFLTKFCKKITIIHRRDKFRASAIMLERARANPKIHWMTNTVVEDILGTDKVTGLKLKNSATGETNELAVDGVFVAIGHKPNTDIFHNQIELDVKDYIVVRNQTKTNVDGIFVAGDVHDHRYRQAVTAAGFGCMAAMDAEKWLET